MKNSENSGENHRETLWRLVKDTRFAMFTTTHANGHLHSRPMTTQNKSIDETDSLWFFMSRKANTVAEIIAEHQVNVVYANPNKDSYVSVSGEATVVDSHEKKVELWTKLSEAWFPGGVSDPDLALVCVKISHAHYWDVDTFEIVQLYKMAKAVITGVPPKMGKEGEVRISGSQH